MAYDPLDNLDSATLVSDILFDVQECMAFVVLMANQRSELFTHEELEYISKISDLVDPDFFEEIEDNG